MHLPRSVFSHRQLDLFLWLLKVNDVDDVPSVRTMQTLNASLQRMCGIETIEYKGALGHTYHVNNLAQILAQVSSPIGQLSRAVVNVTEPKFSGNGQPESSQASALLSGGYARDQAH